MYFSGDSMNKSICPFGDKYQRYWDKRYHYFSRFDEGIQLDAEGCHTVMPEESALALAARLSYKKTVIDGFCGVGGISIALARVGLNVFAIELNEERLEMAKHNAKIYGVEDKITFIQGDYYSIANTLNADAVILDPPWGWPRFLKLEYIRLEHLNPYGEELLDFSMRKFKTIILRIPKNFDFTSLDSVIMQYEVYADLLHGEAISQSILITNEKIDS
jgi:trimethylguanosine synthase